MGDLNRKLDAFIKETLSEVDPNLDEELRGDDEEYVEPEKRATVDKMRLSFVETLRASVWEFGGPEGVARELRDTFKRSPVGSATRANIISRLITGIQDYGEDDRIDDAESVEAIEAELKAIAVQEILEKIPKSLRDEVEKHLT